ncbi:MAG: hypothetical protein A2Y38_23435 [Spirochaetes bacterium GWB1_59_5]|nr:MAG: hypothetical protein A2Y38_23435 [Spirochaetes bacterium GWB1_59_5]
MTKSKTEPIPPFKAEDILVALLQRALSDKRAEAYPISDWQIEDGRKPTLTGESIYLRRPDAQPLVDAGLLHYEDNGTIHWHLTVLGVQEAAKLVPGGIPALDLKGLLTKVFDLAYFVDTDESGEPAIPFVWDQGDPASKLVLVLGENAGGKSFFRRIIRELTRIARVNDMGKHIPAGPFPVAEMVHLSMEGRTGGGFASSCVYGTEGWLSTGANSAHTITKGIETLQGRGHRTVAYWDEPDIGMSNGCAAGAGVTLRTFVESPSLLVQAIFVTTHSVPLAWQLTTGLTHKPHYVYLGSMTPPATLADWFVAQQSPVPVSPEALHETGNRRFLRIRDILNRKD